MSSPSSSLLLSWAESQASESEVDTAMMARSPLHVDPLGAVKAWTRGAMVALERGDSRPMFGLLYAGGALPPRRRGRPPRGRS